MPILPFLLRPIFHLLYHQFAWTYDYVAALVSLGRWKDWVLCALPLVQGARVLEIGHGPGHLQLALHERGAQVYGLDESRQMGRQARRRLLKRGRKAFLMRGRAQFLPLGRTSFDTVVATFPAEYILDPSTLAEIWRVLTPGGRLVILPMAWITGRKPLERLMAWLFRVTGEVTDKSGILPPGIKDRLARAGFEANSEAVELPGSRVLTVICQKT